MSHTAFDEEFKEAGKKEGLSVWRIENFKLVKQKPEQYGN